MGMSGFDLRDFNEGGECHEDLKNAFGKLISGRDGYNPVLDKNKPVKKCECGKVLSGEEKFCPECGKKAG